MADERYYLSRNNLSHCYIVPLARRSELEAWSSLGEDDEAHGDAPEWAKRVNGSPEVVTFRDPRIEGGPW
jgi:hypothetical protein